MFESFTIIKDLFAIDSSSNKPVNIKGKTFEMNIGNKSKASPFDFINAVKSAGFKETGLYSFDWNRMTGRK